MSTDNAGSAAPQENSVPLENPTKDTVAYDTYRRVLSEAKKLKDELKAIKEQEQKSQEEKLKEQNEWKALAELRDQEAKKFQAMFQEQNEQIVNGMKFQEFEKQLGGRLVSQDYASFIPFDKIVINPETGKPDPESAKLVATDFAKNHSRLVDFGNSPKIPNVAPVTAPSFGSKTVDKMDPKEMAEYIIELGKQGKLK